MVQRQIRGINTVLLIVLCLALTAGATAQPVPPPAEDCGCGTPANPRGPR